MELSGFSPAQRPSFGRSNTAEAELDKVRKDRYAHIMGHEQAHKAAAGSYSGSIAIQYDSNGIAVAGHVPISIPGLDPDSPEKSLNAYHTIRSAALAPGDPSGADMAVAATAQALMGKAKILMDRKKQGQPRDQAQPPH